MWNICFIIIITASSTILWKLSIASCERKKCARSCDIVVRQCIRMRGVHGRSSGKDHPSTNILQTDSVRRITLRRENVQGLSRATALIRGRAHDPRNVQLEGDRKVVRTVRGKQRLICVLDFHNLYFLSRYRRNENIQGKERRDDRRRSPAR